MDQSERKFLQRLPLANDKPLIGYGVALLICGTALGLRFVVDRAMPVGYPYLSFFPAVILSTFLFGRGPGIFAGILCGLASWYFFIPPFYNFGLSAGTVLTLSFYALVVGVDIAVIHWMQRANHELIAERERSDRLAEKSDLLFRELQHRVSNNLQVVAALIALQKRDISDPKALAALDEAARRLALIGRIHRQLHDPTGRRLGMGTFLRQLATDLIDAGGKLGIACEVEADDNIELDADAAIPIALIVAEAVANALEHGFADRDTGRVTILLGRDGTGITLSIADDGKGLPDNFEADQPTSLGLRIATTLARQLGGRFEMIGGKGATARLILPA